MRERPRPTPEAATTAPRTRQRVVINPLGQVVGPGTPEIKQEIAASPRTRQRAGNTLSGFKGPPEDPKTGKPIRWKPAPPPARPAWAKDGIPYPMPSNTCFMAGPDIPGYKNHRQSHGEPDESNPNLRGRIIHDGGGYRVFKWDPKAKEYTDLGTFHTHTAAIDPLSYHGRSKTTKKETTSARPQANREARESAPVSGAGQRQRSRPAGAVEAAPPIRTRTRGAH